jgi:hypothetical protein
MGNDAGSAGTEQLCGEGNVGPAPLRLLTRRQINNTLQDLFGDILPNEQLPLLALDPKTAENVEPASLQLVDDFRRLAQSLAFELTQDAEVLAALTGCEMNAQTTPCRDEFLASITERLHRKPAGSDELEQLQATFELGRELGGDFAAGARAVLQVLLQGAEFLYLVEFGDESTRESDSDLVELTGYETAARLAYFVTASAPDAELMQAAAIGSLRKSNELEAQARRLFVTPRGRERVWHFYEAWLGVAEARAHAVEHPLASTKMATLAHEETRLFVENVLYQRSGTFRELLSEPTTWRNEPLAAAYGETGVRGEAFQEVKLDAQRRRGLFTQSSFLRQHGYAENPGTIQRGHAFLQAVLCHEVPPPPADMVFPDLMVPELSTQRQRIELATSDPTCQNCHRDMDAAGFLFEHYDAFGAWRDKEGGLPIDSSGALFDSDLEGTYPDAVSMLETLALSQDARACHVLQWVEAAYAREFDDGIDGCTHASVVERFSQADSQIVELAAALAATPRFRYRLRTELLP